MRGLVFAKRTLKEILRDPLSYIFCLGFPIVMLLVMTVVNKSIPAQAGMNIFEMDNLAPGMAYFGLSFVMIFTAIQISTDRSTSLVTRLHASPMKPADFIVGYTLPVIGVAFLQIIITYAAAFVLALITGSSLSFVGVLLSIPALLPGAMVFIGLGLLFGTLLNEKASPGACSVIVTVSGMLGGIWMPVDTMGGTILKIAKCMPFYHGVNAARNAVGLDFSQTIKYVIITCIWALVIYVIAVLLTGRKLKKDVM